MLPVYSAMIVDDEQPSLDLLDIFLKKTAQIDVVGKYLSTDEALSEVKKLKPDIAFVDIEVPGMSGLELAEKIAEVSRDTEIIFVTGHEQYAIEAFRVNAMDYILKPLSYPYLLKVIDRFIHLRLPKAPSQTPEDKGRIYCFDKFLVFGAGAVAPIAWRTAKTAELFAILVQNENKIVPKWKLAHALWPELEEGKGIINLHTSVYNLRKTLLRAQMNYELLFTNDGYCLSLPDIYIDTKAFLATVDNELKTSTPSLESLETAYGMYKGRYMEENAYAWAQLKSNEYALKYKQLISLMLRLFSDKQDDANAERILLHALEIDPLDDTINELLLSMYLSNHAKRAFLLQYNKTRDRYRADLGIELNANMHHLLEQAQKL